MKTLKLCQDCKHHLTSVNGPQFDRCTAVPMSEGPEFYINGEWTWQYCTIIRDFGQCGRKAKLFEPMEETA